MPLRPIKGHCDQCDTGDIWIVSKKALSGNWCMDCTRAKNPKKAKPFRPKRKVTGEGALFRAIWNTRRHNCEVCSKHLGLDPRAHYFAHIIPKGKYPDFRLFDINIAFLCMLCHTTWDTQRWKCHTNHNKWEKIFRREHELKELYKKGKQQGEVRIDANQ